MNVILRRWQEWTGKSSTREIDGVAFDELASGGTPGPDAPGGGGEEDTVQPNR